MCFIWYSIEQIARCRGGTMDLQKAATTQQLGRDPQTLDYDNAHDKHTPRAPWRLFEKGKIYRTAYSCAQYISTASACSVTNLFIHSIMIAIPRLRSLLFRWHWHGDIDTTIIWRAGTCSVYIHNYMSDRPASF
jgi:hypothetical protein